MSISRLILPPLALLAALGGVTGLRAEKVRRVPARTRPPCTCGIPAADYQYQSRSLSTAATSRIAVLVERTTVEAVQQALREAQEAAAKAAEAARDEALPVPTEPLPTPPPDRAARLGPLPFTGRPASAIRPLPPAAPATVFERLPNGQLRAIRQPVILPPSPLARLPVVPPRTPENRRKIKLYQLSQAQLTIDHCSISRVALQFRNDGSWVLSLRADQNPAVAARDASYEPRLHLKRNLFAVRVRGYGSFPEPPSATALAVGKPEMVALKPLDFWVQRGEPRYLRATGRNRDIQEFFELIDRIELEFFYR